jgi:glycosyltransferase involved in cell wall biosynthesis
MRILQLSTFDVRFGAAIAARRLHEALLDGGQESDLLVSEVQSDSRRTHGPRTGFEKFRAKVAHHIDKLPLKLYPRRVNNVFSPNWVPSNLPERVKQFHCDVIHMHWCQSNFVPTSTLSHLNRPLIWTFHDMWAFTGGCHYTSGCDHYFSECGQCPVLQSSGKNDLSHWVWKQKQSVYRRIRKSLQIICPSNWMAGLARNAPLLEGIPVHVVPNPINTRLFKPIDKLTARRLLGLPDKGPLLLVGATSKGDRRKGFDLLDEALRHYAGQADSPPLGLVTLGTNNSSMAPKSAKLQAWNIGFLQDEISLSALYNAVDIVALPSREENLSNALAEALCCGVPCLAFAIGGNADLISHQENGFLAKPGDAVDMAAGLTWILNHLGEDCRDRIAQTTHKKVSYESLVPTFLGIYQAALN